MIKMHCRVRYLLDFDLKIRSGQCDWQMECRLRHDNVIEVHWEDKEDRKEWKNQEEQEKLADQKDQEDLDGLEGLGDQQATR